VQKAQVENPRALACGDGRGIYKGMRCYDEYTVHGGAEKSFIMSYFVKRWTRALVISPVLGRENNRARLVRQILCSLEKPSLCASRVDRGCFESTPSS
jgi:hypothetical protein